jgi:hypothetical protein
VILKDGTMPSDPRLGRLTQFDERSRAYPVMATLVAPAPPRSYTWSVPVPALDQGSEGSCVGHAWAHELLARPAVASGVDHPYARRIYHEAQRIDPWPGGAYEGAEPRYEGTSILAGAKVVAGLGAMTEYRWAFSIDELALAVGYKGPAVLGIPWYESMFHPDEAGQIRVAGDAVGGHAILCRGVSVRLRLFRLRNSWGAWGLNGSGDCLISFDDLGRLLHEGGEACVPAGRKTVRV